MKNQKTIVDGENMKAKDKITLSEGEVSNEIEMKIESASFEIRVIEILNKLKISVGSLGYKCLKTAILLCIEDNSYLDEVVKKLYPTVAKTYNIAPIKAARAIQDTVKKVDFETLNEIFDYSCNFKRTKITSYEFIAIVVEKLILENNKSNVIEIRINRVLVDLGIQVSSKGYFYLKSAIMLCLDDNEYLNSITNNLYPSIAKIYNTTCSRVEKAIRYAIEVAWDKGNLELLDEIFSYSVNSEKGKATNLEFIAAMVEKLKLENNVSSEYDQRVANVLGQLGIPTNVKGYCVLKSGVILCLEDANYLNNIRNKLYPTIARICNTTCKSVEHAIYCAIERAWNRGNSQLINEFFSDFINRGIKPSCREFITTVVKKLGVVDS